MLFEFRYNDFFFYKIYIIEQIFFIFVLIHAAIILFLVNTRYIIALIYSVLEKVYLTDVFKGCLGVINLYPLNVYCTYYMIIIKALVKNNVLY